MRSSTHLKRLAAALVIVTGCVCSSRSQTITYSDQASALVELLNNIKRAVQNGGHANPTEVYRTVSIRLVHCAIIHSLNFKEQNSEQSRSGTNILMRAATALYPGNAEAFKRVLKDAGHELLPVLGDKKAMFYLRRNCRDLWKADSVEGAVTELLL